MNEDLYNKLFAKLRELGYTTTTQTHEVVDAIDELLPKQAPLTIGEVHLGYVATRGIDGIYSAFEHGVAFAERHHKIAEKP